MSLPRNYVAGLSLIISNTHQTQHTPTTNHPTDMASSSSFFLDSAASTCPIVDTPGDTGIVSLFIVCLFVAWASYALYARFSAPVIGRAVAATLTMLFDDPNILRYRRNTTPNLLTTSLPDDADEDVEVLCTRFNVETVLFPQPVATSAVVFVLSDESVASLRELAYAKKIFVVCCNASMKPGELKPGELPELHSVLCVLPQDHSEVAAKMGCAVTTLLGHRVTTTEAKKDGAATPKPVVRVRGICTPEGADPEVFGKQTPSWQGVGAMLGRAKTYRGEEIAPKLKAAVAANAATFLKRPFHYYQILVVPNTGGYSVY
jgi:hypothetical protein